MMRNRILWILAKWSIKTLIPVVLYIIGFFNVLFAIFLIFIGEVNLFLDWLGTGTQLEAKEYWAEYGRYWLIAYVVLSIILLIFYFIPYRRVRPVLKVGDRKEGVVVWIKGIRRGLGYEIWDVVNYLKKTKPSPMGWPNPLAVPRGPDMRHGVCIAYRIPWSLKPKYLYLPDTVRVESRLLSIHIPDGYFINRPNPDRLDIQDLRFVSKSAFGFETFDVGQPFKMHKEHLIASRKMVQRSVASNPEINQMDFTTGSFAVLGADDGD